MPIHDGTALLSTNAVEQAISPNGTIPFIPFIKIPVDGEIYRFCANTETITVAGDGDYLPGNFDVSWPEDTDSAASPVQITIGMVDREVCDRLVQFNGIIEVESFTALATTPHIREQQGRFVIKSVEHDAVTLRGTLGFEETIYMQKFPKRRMTPSSHPGYFV